MYDQAAYRIEDRIQEREEHTGYGDSFQPRGVHARIDLYHSPSKRVATVTPLPLARITQI